MITNERVFLLRVCVSHDLRNAHRSRLLFTVLSESEQEHRVQTADEKSL